MYNYLILYLSTLWFLRCLVDSTPHEMSDDEDEWNQHATPACRSDPSDSDGEWAAHAAPAVDVGHAAPVIAAEGNRPLPKPKGRPRKLVPVCRAAEPSMLRTRDLTMCFRLFAVCQMVALRLARMYGSDFGHRFLLGREAA